MNVMIARKRKKLTQDQVCEAVGIGRSTLSKIENGKDLGVTKELMIKISNYLGVSIQELFFSDQQTNQTH